MVATRKRLELDPGNTQLTIAQLCAKTLRSLWWCLWKKNWRASDCSGPLRSAPSVIPSGGSEVPSQLKHHPQKESWKRAHPGPSFLPPSQPHWILFLPRCDGATELRQLATDWLPGISGGFFKTNSSSHRIPATSHDSLPPTPTYPFPYGYGSYGSPGNGIKRDQCHICQSHLQYLQEVT